MLPFFCEQVQISYSDLFSPYLSHQFFINAVVFFLKWPNLFEIQLLNMCHKSVACHRKCWFYWAYSPVSEIFLCCHFLFSFSFYHTHLMLPPTHPHPLMKSVGSVIFSTVSWVSPLPNASRSSQNSVGPTDRNSLPCRYQSPPLLTIILICLSLFHSQSPPPVPPAHLKKKQDFTLICTDRWTTVQVSVSLHSGIITGMLQEMGASLSVMG